MLIAECIILKMTLVFRNPNSEFCIIMAPLAPAYAFNVLITFFK